MSVSSIIVKNTHLMLLSEIFTPVIDKFLFFSSEPFNWWYQWHLFQIESCLGFVWKGSPFVSKLTSINNLIYIIYQRQTVPNQTSLIIISLNTSYSNIANDFYLNVWPDTPVNMWYVSNTYYSNVCQYLEPYALAFRFWLLFGWNWF